MCSQRVAPGGRRSSGSARPTRSSKRSSSCEGGVGVGGGVDRPQVGGDLLAVAVVDVAQRARIWWTMQVCTQAWGKTASIASGKPVEAVDAGDQDVLDAAAVQVVEDGQPELRALGLLPPDPEHLALAVAGHAHREVAGAGADRAVLADLDASSRRSRRSGRRAPAAGCATPRRPPSTASVIAADRVAADLDAVELGQVRRDVADASCRRRRGRGSCRPGPASRVWRLATSCGSKLPSRSRGVLDLDRPQIGLHRLGASTPLRTFAPCRRRRPADGRDARSARPPARSRSPGPRAASAARPAR